MEIDVNLLMPLFLVLFVMIVVIPVGFKSYKRFKLKSYSKDEAVWELLKREVADSDEGDDNGFEYFRAVVASHIMQSDSAKHWLNFWLLFSLFMLIQVGIAVYKRVDFSAVVPMFSSAGSTFHITSGVLITLASFALYFYKRKEFKDLRIFLDSFAEAHNVEGDLTVDKLYKIETIKLGANAKDHGVGL